jgi:hypothetical protein
VYEIEIYEDSKGNSELKDWLRELKHRKDKGNKDAKITLNQIHYCIQRIKSEGTYTPRILPSISLKTFGSFVLINIEYCSSKFNTEGSYY